MNKNGEKVLLFANGDFPAPDRLVDQINEDDYLIAVDGGLRHITRLGLTPDLIIGDLDSANKQEVAKFRAQGVEVNKFPADKDETDLELALDAALQMGITVIWIVAALGKRLDQTLGNIFLLTHPDLAGYDIRLVDGGQEVFLIRHSASISGKTGQRLSLLPLHGPAQGIHTQGLQYPLKNETLYSHKTRGISNRLNKPSATITLEEGLLLCIHETTNPTQRNANYD